MDLRDEAEAYAAADFSEVNALFVERLLTLCGELEEATGVDLGAGPADIPIRLARARPRWQLVAVDAAAAMLELARQGVNAARLTGAIELRLADATRTDLHTASCDVVFCNSILHHVADPDALWREVRRLLRPGGLVLVRDLFRPSSAARARELVDLHAGDESALLQEEFYRSLLAAYTVDEVRAQLELAGLAQLEVELISDRHLEVFGRIEAS